VFVSFVDLSTFQKTACFLDVSWRYSADHAAVRGRRHDVREQWLTQTLLKLSEQCQKGYTEDQKKKITERRLSLILKFIH
jgi:hypothetical protein